MRIWSCGRACAFGLVFGARRSGLVTGSVMVIGIMLTAHRQWDKKWVFLF
jgi:hypothetical protein